MNAHDSTRSSQASERRPAVAGSAGRTPWWSRMMPVAWTVSIARQTQSQNLNGGYPEPPDDRKACLDGPGQRLSREAASHVSDAGLATAGDRLGTTQPPGAEVTLTIGRCHSLIIP